MANALREACDVSGQEERAESPPGLHGGGGALSVIPMDVLQQRLLPLLLSDLGLRYDPAAQSLSALADVVRLSRADRRLRALVHDLVLPQLEFPLRCSGAEVPGTFPDAAKLLHGVLAKRREEEQTELVLSWTEEDFETEERTEFRVSAGCALGPDQDQSLNAKFELDENCSDGDFGEQNFTMELVDTADHQRVLAKMDVVHFGGRKLATFRSFDGISAGMCDFAQTVLTASGHHSSRIINELIAQALGENFQEKISSSTLYLNTERAQMMRQFNPGAPKHVSTLLRKACMFFEMSYVIGHETDLPPGLGFSELPGWRQVASGGKWHVRLPEEYNR